VSDGVRLLVGEAGVEVALHVLVPASVQLASVPEDVRDLVFLDGLTPNVAVSPLEKV
jgi:hypothetical protein